MLAFILATLCFLPFPASAEPRAAEDPLGKWTVLQEERLRKNAPDNAHEQTRNNTLGAWLQHKHMMASDDKLAEPLPWNIQVDGRDITVKNLLRGFVQKLFPDRSALWHPDVFLFSYHHAQKKDRLPRFDGLSKWASPLRITFKTVENNFVVDEEEYGYLISHLKMLIPFYTEASGLDMSYTPLTYPKHGDANVVIVLNLYEGNRNAFKHGRDSNYHGITGYETHHDFPLIRFTPGVRSQVEGFFIPNAHNEIEAATCYLTPSLLPKDINKALLNECLIRALGFPGVALDKGSVLSQWNIAFDPVSYVLTDDLKNKTIPDEDTWRIQLLEKIDAVLSSKSHAATHDGQFPIYPSSFDLLDVSLLYCEAVHAGEDAYNTVITLLKTDLCGNRGVEEKE